jgi:hypothetical protein
MGTITGLTAERMLQIEAESVHQASVDVSALVPAVDAGTGAQGSLELGKAYRLDKFVVDKPCRLRLYASSGYRSADADRPRDEDPVGDHGCILELFAVPDLLTMLLLPMPHGYVESGFTYFSIVNDGDTGDINFTFTEHVLET